RYPHWKWGAEYDRMSKRDAYGLGRIYEMVINNDPCYAYLQESNSVTDQKLVMAHVYGHADFFKHNVWFSKTDRKMMDTMANHATRVRRHIENHGHARVERFIDRCLSIEHLIDPHSVFVKREGTSNDQSPFEPSRMPAKDYMDPFVNPQSEIDAQKAAHEAKSEADKSRFPSEPTKDVLLFLIRNAKLEDWQADILGIIRSEAYYYAPQAQTKVMNEGWATYWHSKLMTNHFLESSEIIHYADQHSGVVHMAPGGFNPYKIGVELFKDIERRWDRGQHGHAYDRLDDLGAKKAHDDGSMACRDKIFQIRTIYNDVNFIDEFLTPEFVDKHKMYQTGRDPRTGEVKIVSRDFGRVKQTLLYKLTNMGQPMMYVADANYGNRGELYLANKWNGLEVDIAAAMPVLQNLCAIWGRPVHLQARVQDDMWLYSCASPDGDPAVTDDGPITRQQITDGTPPPANIVG
ncbi:MAG: SpoVR family protein, partial [Planctomycetota bacterium]